MKRVILASGLVLLFTTPAVRALDEYVDLHCWAPVTINVGGTNYSVPPDDRSTGITWADPALDQTDASGGTSTQSSGFEFPWGSREEIQCSLVLPASYVTTGNTPQVTLEGWGLDNSDCPPGNNPPVNFTFEVSSRTYAAGDIANAAWSTATSGTTGFTCPVFVQSKDVVKSVTINATSSASNWAPSQLAFIRIQRVSNDSFNKTFHLARVRLRLPE